MAPDQPIPDPINSEEITAVSSTKPVHRWKKKTVPGGIQNDCISIQHLLTKKLVTTGQPENYVVLLTKNCPWPINVATILLEESCNGTEENGTRGRKRSSSETMTSGHMNGCGKMPAFSLIESSTASAKMPAKLQRRNRPWLGKTLTQCNEKSVWKLNRRRVAEGREEFVRKNTCTLENNRALPWSKCPQCCWEIAEQDVEKRCTIVGRKHLQSSQNVGLVQAENKRILDNRKSGYGKITAATMVASWITSLHYCWVTLTTDVAKCMHSNWKKATPD
ncbi:hypothetical protein T4E_9643 [Trichinella pseudospiralis]|uniref:Uncharacterized protein n=1 Tax=Trichinella pseudospiralis TaxID=6337 RepID=A0A0V0XEG8_TRIPS|nr:hypothetical protein T4E_9643 [Trichinella pseudospiralis]